MADKIILIDTSIFIDHFRKSNKANSKLSFLYEEGYSFCISVVTQFEIFTGAPANQLDYWTQLLQKIKVLDFNIKAADIAVDINRKLKSISKQIDTADLFIAATALSNNLPIATLNIRHFDRIRGLTVIG